MCRTRLTKVTHPNWGSPAFSTDVNFTREHPEKAREDIFSSVFFFFLLPAEALFRNGGRMGENKTQNNQNKVFKIKTHFRAVILGFCISCLSINCCQTQDVRSIWQMYASPVAKCFLKMQGLRYSVYSQIPAS